MHTLTNFGYIFIENTLPCAGFLLNWRAHSKVVNRIAFSTEVAGLLKNISTDEFDSDDDR